MTGNLFPWTPQGAEETKRFEHFEAITTLDWYDGPRLFTIRENNITYLAYLCSELPGLVRYLVVPADSERVEALASGAMTLLQALKSPVLWVVDVEDNDTKRVRRIPWSNVPSSVVPKPHVLLSRNLEPIFRVYVEGEHLASHSITASLLKKYVDNSYRLLHRFFENKKWPGGFDPPVQQLALGSLMVSYGAPGKNLDDSAANELRSEFGEKIGQNGDREMVEAVQKMCPFKAGGPVDSVTISGQLLPATSLVLARGDRVMWTERRDAVVQVQTSSSVTAEGNVEEIDGGRGTFTLRDIIGEPGEIRCRADDDIISELREDFAEGFPRIRINGTRLAGETVVRVDRYEPIASAARKHKLL